MPRKPRKPSRKPVRGRPPLKLRTAKALDKLYRELGDNPEQLSMNDRKVLERVRHRLEESVLRPLTEADLSNVKRIAKKIGLKL
jgi:hypothetical protein